MNLRKVDIPQYENYQITSCGRIFKKAGWVKWGNLPDRWVEEKEFIPRKDKYGYLRIHLTNDEGRKFIPIHRLVGKVFVEGYSEEKNTINHIDGNKENNNFYNLEWVTVKYNNQHKWNVVHRTNRGTLYSDTIIRKMLKEVIFNQEPLRDISKKFSISIPVVRGVLIGKIHSGLYEEFGGDRVLKPVYEQIKKCTMRARTKR